MKRDQRRDRRAERRAARKVKATATVVKKRAQVKAKVKQAKKLVKQGITIAALNPFKPLMIVALRRKNITPKRNLEDLARQFYQEVVKKSDFETANAVNAANPDENLLTFDTQSVDMYENLAPIAITAIVEGILSFFKGVKAKADAGEPLTPAEDAIAEGVDEVEKAVKQTVVDEIEAETGAAVLEYAPFIGVALVGVVVFLLVKKK